GVDTDDNSADFAVTDQLTPTNAAATGGEPTPEPEPQPTPAERITIAQLQGTGTATPYAGRQVTTTGGDTAVYSTGG
ncbi:hypothetical protein QP834_17665, partial [Enterococcus faecalis]|nr:hypothetical protein [Enterococcus faecalis]